MTFFRRTRSNLAIFLSATRWPLAGAGLLCVLMSAGVVAASSDDRAEHAVENVNAETLRKLDPALRMRFQGDPEAELTAMVSLSEPLPEQVLSGLRGNGLQVLSAREDRLHVRGKPDALVALAERPEVESLRHSGAMRPSE